MGKKILVVEDEYSINDVLTIGLRSEGYEVKSVYDGKNALEQVKEFNPDLVILDLMLPDIDGFEVCKTISNDYLVVMLTARENIFDKILGLELGADDYITKPFEIREVVARIKAIFRRVRKEYDRELEKKLILPGNITVDLQGQRVFRNGSEIELKRKETGLFFHFINNRNKVFTRDELLNEIWGYDYYGDGRTVDVHIRRLRAKVDITGESIIETVFGTGYVMR
ncbi:MAG: response regulator transcription factor [Clostridium sp.]|uniref:response regulator transcription factor n=1 Tax=Clostridium sp. TaxID=1506 RepID=UPI003042CAD4